MTEADKSGFSRTNAAVLGTFLMMVWAPFIRLMLINMSAVSGPLEHDIGLQWVPFTIFTGRAFSEGYFPLWTSNVFAGMPYAAFSHTAVFYPLRFILHLADYAVAANIYYPVHLSIAGSGVYMLCKRLELSCVPAWFAAVGYAFAGKIFYFIHFLPSCSSNAWVPWFLWAALSLLLVPRFRYMVLAGVFLALQILGGDVESTSYALVLSVPALAILTRGRDLKFTGIAALGFAFGLAALFSMIQLLPLYEYSQHFIRNDGVTFSYFSQRDWSVTIIPFLFLPAKAFTPAGAAIFDGPSFYLGITTMAAAGLAFFKRPVKSSKPLGILVLVNLLWAFGLLGLMDRFQFLLPVLDSFGSPEHSLFMAQLFLVILAAHGLKALTEAEISRGYQVTLLKLLGGALVIMIVGRAHYRMFSSPEVLIALFLAGAAVIAYLTVVKSPRVLMVSALVLVFLQLGDVYLLAQQNTRSNDPAIFEYPEWLEKTAERVGQSNSRYAMATWQGLEDQELMYHAGMALDMDAIDGWITVPPKRYAEFISLADPRAARFEGGKLDSLGLNNKLKDGRFISADSMPILDLISLRYLIVRELPIKFSSPYFLRFHGPHVHKRSVPNGEASKMEYSFLRDPERRLFDKIFTGPNELYSFRLFIQRSDRLEFTPHVEHTDQTRGPADTTMLVTIQYEKVNQDIFRWEGNSAEIRELERKSIDLMPYSGKDAVISFQTMGPETRDDLVFSWDSLSIVNDSRPLQVAGAASPKVLVYENTEALARAFPAGDFEVISGDEAILERLSQADKYDFSQKIFLEREPDRRPSPSGPPFRGVADKKSGSFGREVYRVMTNRAGFLFVSDQWYPGWRARVRGREAPIYRANYCFRAVPIEAGESEVEMIFEPASFRIGLMATLTSLLFVPVALLFGRKRRNHSSV